MTFLKSAIAVAALALFASQAQAHAHLKSAVPAAEASVTGSPKELRATFSETLAAAFSKLELTTDKGAPVVIGKSTLDPKNHHTLIAELPTPLKAGSYSVNWTAVSADTHRMTGHYGFRVLP
jgi:methionine-rich copper-binding protein CopC